MDQYCTKCGTHLVIGVCPNCSGVLASPQFQQSQQSQPSVTNTTPNDEKFKKIFMSPKEKFVCALGNNYVQNFLANGFLGKGFAVVSDKRVYFKGKAYELGEKKLRIKTVASTVDLKDVTGTETRTINPIVALILGIITAFLGLSFLVACAIQSSKRYSHGGEQGLFILSGILLLIGGIASIIGYFSSRKTLLTIMFGGGGIAFPLNWYPAKEGEKFQKSLRIAKDKAVEEAENATANAMREVMANAAAQPQQPVISPADELAKYAQLYKDGMITEQEFADIKAKLLAKQ